MNLKPADGVAWDLSAFGHVEARVVNTGSRAARFALRVDNAGPWQKGPWNTEEVRTGRGIERERRPLGQGVPS